MKFFIVMWLCIQSPTVPLDKTCVTQVIQTAGYNSMQECKFNAVMYANKVMVVPDGLPLISTISVPLAPGSPINKI